MATKAAAMPSLIKVTPKKRPLTTASVFATTAAVFSVLLFAGVLLYNVVVYRDVVLAQARERDLRREFVEIPNVDRFHFVATAIEESRKIVESGLFTSAFRRWWEQTSLFTLFTLDSLYLKITCCVGFIVAIIAGLYMYFQYASNKYWMDRAVETRQAMAQQMYTFASGGGGGGGKSTKRHAAAVNEDDEES